ncbi:MAG: hypothetical protein RRA35_01035 [Desulfomonilia bacterium]|nr:hypothetical protein [Desulfomonilia bacterium]
MHRYMQSQMNISRKDTQQSKTTLYDLLQQINEHLLDAQADDLGISTAKNVQRNRDKIVAETIVDMFMSGRIQFVHQDALRKQSRDLFL